MAMDGNTTRYGDLCRLCATKTSIVLGLNVFEAEGSVRQLKKKIETCLPIQIHETDDLPKMICESCLYKLEQFFEFRERALRTESLLFDLFKEINSTHEQLELGNQIVKITNPTSSMDMVTVTMSHPDIVMVHHQQSLLHQHSISPVSDLHQNMIAQVVEQEIILGTHQSMDISQSLDGIELNHHELTSHELSNHSLHGQEITLHENQIVDNNIHDGQLSDRNLNLLEQHANGLLNEQYRLEDHDLQVNIEDHEQNDDCVSDMTMVIAASQTERILAVKDKSNIKVELVKIESADKRSYSEAVDDPYDSDADFDPIPTTNKRSSKERVKNEDNSNSECRLLIDDPTDAHQLLLLNETDKRSTSTSASSSTLTDWYYCNICEKTIGEKEKFQAHYEEHFSKCSGCLAVFTNKEALNAHKKEMLCGNSQMTDIKLEKHEPKSNKDLGSDASNDATKYLTKTEDEEDEDDPDGDCDVEENNTKRKKSSSKVCKECGKSYKTNYKLAEHMRKHTGEQPYKCGSCDKAFRSKIGLAQHEAKHTGHYDYSCPTCGKGFQCKSYLVVHQRVHSDLKPYPCTTCGRNFKTKQSLLDHMNRHLGVKPYMCDVCGRGFITKGLCKSHQKIHTGVDNRKFSCKVCKKMFVSKSYLQTHLRIHTGEKPFMCEVCGKGFLTRVDLRIHSTMHTGEKSYVCEMCGKAFARRDALRCHRRSHTGERPYSCDLCGQTFTQFSPMAIHKRLHTGERPYSCEVCNKTFVSRSTMMAHWKKHVR